MNQYKRKQLDALRNVHRITENQRQQAVCWADRFCAEVLPDDDDPDVGFAAEWGFLAGFRTALAAQALGRLGLKQAQAAMLKAALADYQALLAEREALAQPEQRVDVRGLLLARLRMQPQDPGPEA